jgi:uncharacterized protein YcbX
MSWRLDHLPSSWLAVDNTLTMVWGTLVLIVVWILFRTTTTTSLPQRLRNILHKAISIMYFRYLLWKQLQQKKNDDDNDDDDDDSTVVATVSGIYIHPVKSMRAVSLSESLLDSGGLAHDRQFMVVYETPLPPYLTKWEDHNTSNTSVLRYRYLTQRQCPSLATITATLVENQTKLNLQVSTNRNLARTSIEISLTGQPPVRSRNTQPSATTPTTTTETSTATNSTSTTPTKYFAGIWDDTVLVEDMGDEAAAFLQDIVNVDSEPYVTTTTTTTNVSELGHVSYTVRLVRQVPTIPVKDYRAVDSKFAPLYANTWWGLTPSASLTDGYPLLIATEASLQDVNHQLSKIGKSTIPMNRFRPNIVLKGTTANSLKAFDEDQWKVIAIGNNVLLAIVKACPRCKQCCTDQTTGTVTEEPVAVMKSFRALGDNDKSSSSSKDVFFAQNAISFGGLGGMQSIRVGDAVRILKRGEPIYR